MRRLEKIVSALSLLLCVAAVVLWVRCHVPFGKSWYEALTWGHFEIDERTTTGFLYVARSSQGRIYYKCYRRAWMNPLPAGMLDAEGRPRMGVPKRMYFGRGNMAEDSSPHVLGFQYRRFLDSPRRRGMSQDIVVVGVPYWFIVATSVAYPARRIFIWGRRRDGSGRCGGCGYDLRASPGRCPECGLEGGRVERSGRVFFRRKAFVAGVGTFFISLKRSVAQVPSPCPLPEGEGKGAPKRWGGTRTRHALWVV